MCGHGRLFPKWFRMVEHCPGCGFRFEREPGHWVGALGMNTVASFGLLLVTIVAGIVMTAPDIAVVPVVTASVAVAVGAPLLLFPFSRTAWSAIDLLMRPLEEGELPDPRSPGGT